MKTDQELREYMTSHPGLSVRKIQNNLWRQGIRAEQIERVQATISGGQKAPAPAPKPTVRVKLKTLADFRKMHDNPQKIRNGLALLSAGSYLTEEEFRQFCNIPANLWRRNAELPEFADNKLRHAGVVYWGSKDTVEEMKTIIGAA